MENNNRRKLGTYQICLIALAIVMNVIGGQIALAPVSYTHLRVSNQ